MTGEDIILSQSEYEALLEEIRGLQARISQLTAIRDDLVYHVCPSLQAEYEEKIASLERELLAAEMYLRENQRILEILQAQINRQKKPSYEEAAKEAREEFREYEEELKRKAKEAEDFKQHWEKNSKWSEHDRKEKEEKQKQKEQKQQKTAQDRADDSKNKSSFLDDEKEDSYDDRLEDDDQFEGEREGSESSGYQGDKSKRRKNRDSHSDQLGIDDDFEDKNDTEQDFAGDTGEEPSSEETDSPIKKLKRLYRRIVKRLHPDVHPNSTMREKELFNMAQEAMKNGDLDAMEHIYDELSGMDAPEVKFEDTPEGIANLKELIRKLRNRLSRLQSEITHIRSVFPYTMKSFLEDEKAVEERRHELQKKLRDLREANEKLVDFIDKLKKQMGI